MLSGDPVLGRKTVLVVDDDATVRDLLEMIVADEIGALVVTAADGAEALRKAGEWRPDLVLLDLMMPEIDGWEVCRRLKADPLTRRIPVVAISAASGAGPALEAGCDAFVGKPFDYDDIVDIARRLLHPIGGGSGLGGSGLGGGPSGPGSLPPLDRLVDELT